MKLKEWGIFTLLGLIWGSSFLWIKIAVEDVHPLVLVTFRVLFGLIGLLIAIVVVISQSLRGLDSRIRLCNSNPRKVLIRLYFKYRYA